MNIYAPGTKIKNYPHQWPAARTTGFELSDTIVEFIGKTR